MFAGIEKGQQKNITIERFRWKDLPNIVAILLLCMIQQLNAWIFCLSYRRNKIITDYVTVNLWSVKSMAAPWELVSLECSVSLYNKWHDKTPSPLSTVSNHYITTANICSPALTSPISRFIKCLIITNLCPPTLRLIMSPEPGKYEDAIAASEVSPARHSPPAMLCLVFTSVSCWPGGGTVSCQVAPQSKIYSRNYFRKTKE